MKVIILQNVLAEALVICGRCRQKSTVIPILDNFKLDIKNNKVEITGSTLEVFLSTVIECQSDNVNVSLCLPGDQLAGLVKTLPNTPIAFDIEMLPQDKGFKVTLTAGRAKYSLPGENGEHFPVWKGDQKTGFIITSQNLLTGLKKTFFAAQPLSAFSGYNLLFDLQENVLTMTGTNGHILSIQRFTIENKEVTRMILPLTMLSILQTLPMDEIVKVFTDGNYIAFQVNEDTVLRSVLIDGKYPDYEAVIPIANTIQAAVNRGELIGSLKRLLQVSNNVSHMVRFSLLSEHLLVSAGDSDFEREGAEEMAYDLRGAAGLEIGFNATNLLECLQKMDVEDVYLNMTSPNRAMVLSENHFDLDSQPKHNIMLTMPLMLG